jgi:hypothetical protein
MFRRDNGVISVDSPYHSHCRNWGRSGSLVGTTSGEPCLVARWSQIAIDSLSRTSPSIKSGTIPVGLTAK